MPHTITSRVRTLRPELRRTYEALGEHAQLIGLDGPTLATKNGDEIGQVYKCNNRVVLRMDPKPFKGDGWLCVRIGLPITQVYSVLDRLSNQHVIRKRPEFKTQPTWFDILGWDEDLVFSVKSLMEEAQKEFS